MEVDQLWRELGLAQAEEITTELSDLPEHLRNSVEHYRKEKDPEQLAESRLPEGEKFRYYASRLAETFTPTQIRSLTDALVRLEWNDIPALMSQDPALDWIESVRKVPSDSIFYFNLGPILPEYSERQPLGQPLRAEGWNQHIVDRGSATLYRTTHSTFTLAVTFVFTEAAASLIELPFTRQYQTHAEPNSSGGHRIHEPRNLRTDLYRKVRHAVRGHCVSWMEQYLPGVFAERSGSNQHPGVDFIGFEKSEPLPDDHESVPAGSLLQLVELDHQLHGYRSTKHPSLKLSFADIGERNPNIITLSGRLGDLKSNQKMARGGSEPGAVAVDAMDTLGDLFPLWTLGALLRTLEEEVSKIRDQLAAISPNTDASLSHFDEVRAGLLQVSQDSLPFLAEFRALIDQHEPDDRDGSDEKDDFEPVGFAADRRSSFPSRQFAWWRKRIERLSEFQGTVLELTLAAVNTEESRGHRKLLEDSQELQGHIGKLARLQTLFALLLVLLSVLQVSNTLNIDMMSLLRGFIDRLSGLVGL